MSIIKWLHLSDYHWGEHGQSFDRDQARVHLLEDVRSMVSTIGPLNAIFFTGDLVWSGKKTEYKEAARFLDQLLETAGNLSKEHLFVVPGNHDVTWDKITTAVATLCEGLIPRDQSDIERVRRTVNNLLGLEEADRQRIFAKFDDYFQFVKDYFCVEMNASQYFAVRSFLVAGKTIAVIMLNSAWMSPSSWSYEYGFDSGQDIGRLLLGERQLENALSDPVIERADLCIALLHHPLSWLQQGDQSVAKARLYKKCKVILHGHLHEPAIERIIGPDGQTVIIPGGACYNRVDHLNSYNLVKLALDSWRGTIYFRRYFPERGGRWAADTGLYDNVPQGEYTFDLSQPARSTTSCYHTPLPPFRRDTEQAYLRHLIWECSKVPLSPVDPTFVAIASYEHIPLNKVYIPVNVAARTQTERERMEPSPALAVLQGMIDKGRYRFVLLGEPGSGKSTLVNWLAHSLAWLAVEPKDDEERCTQSKIKREMVESGWSHLEWRPVRIILREMVESEVFSKRKEGTEGTAADVWEFLAQDIKKHLPNVRGVVEKYQNSLFNMFSQHGGMVMFDGLDEVPASLRLLLKQAIEDFARTLPRVCILVTCRSYAYQGTAPRLSDDFIVLDLCRFLPEQIETFVDRWYAMRASLGEKEPGWAKNRAQSLKNALKVAPLSDLATRPLFLTLMATLHTAWGTLPQDRASLYEESVELMLMRWQVAKEPSPGGIALRMREKQFHQKVRSAIEEVAYNLHISQERAEREGRAKPDGVERDLLLAALARQEVEKPLEVLDYIRDNAGLLMSSGDSYIFPHRSLQEYLAVSYRFAKPDTPRELAKLVRHNPDWWRESFLLAVGKAMAPRQAALDYAVHLVNTLCPSERPAVRTPTNSDWQVAEIAGAALAEIELAEKHDLDEAHKVVLERVRRWLEACLTEGALSPVERANVGNTLARLGDHRPGVGTSNGLPDILWCEIPAGEFIMGSDVGEPEESPKHFGRTGRYYISRYPITNASFQVFVDAEDGYRDDANWTPAGLEWRKDRVGPDKYGREEFNLPNHPVVMVSWYEADAFCKWLTRRLRNREWPIVDGQFAIWVWKEEEAAILSLPVPEGYVVRLPTQAEFEKAARGVDGRTYPWGEEEDTDPDRANFDETGIGATCAVGMFPRGKSPYGVLDIAGNAWSWCGTLWQDNVTTYPPASRETG